MMIVLGRRGETGKWIMLREKNGQYLIVFGGRIAYWTYHKLYKNDSISNIIYLALLNLFLKVSKQSFQSLRNLHIKKDKLWEWGFQCLWNIIYVSGTGPILPKIEFLSAKSKCSNPGFLHKSLTLGSFSWRQMQ